MNALSLPAVAGALIQRDILVAMRQRADVLTIVFFFVIVASLFPLGIGPETKTLRLIAPGVLLVAALLASMLALNRDLESRLAQQGMVFTRADAASFRARLAGDFYARWKKHFGATLWDLLEAGAGELA